MTERQFSASRKGHLLASILQRPEVIAQMVAAATNDRPAVETIDAEVACLIGPMSNPEKQAAGRVVKRFLAPHGLRPFKKGQRVLGWQVFTRGTVYRQVLPAPNPGQGSLPTATGSSDPVSAARAILAGSRLDLERPLDTVEAFLAERSRDWGDA